jgi:hypothetical protein
LFALIEDNVIYNVDQGTHCDGVQHSVIRNNLICCWWLRSTRFWSVLTRLWRLSCGPRRSWTGCEATPCAIRLHAPRRSRTHRTA